MKSTPCLNSTEVLFKHNFIKYIVADISFQLPILVNQVKPEAMVTEELLFLEQKKI
jgi:hypothetical protein